MSALLRHSIWVSRIVLGAASLLLLQIGMRYVTDPIGASAPHGMSLGSPEAITILRVTGGVFLGIALALVGCLASERRLLVGLGFLATIAATILAIRLVGLAIDGPAPFTLKVLKPEAVLVLLSTVAFLLERGRRRGPDTGSERRDRPAMEAIQRGE
jgi:hypothetical protein